MNNTTTPIKIKLDNKKITNYDEIISFIDTSNPIRDNIRMYDLMTDIYNLLKKNSFDEETLKQFRNIITHYQLHEFDLANDNLSSSMSNSKKLSLANNKYYKNVNHSGNLFSNTDVNNTKGLFIPSMILSAAVSVTGIMYIILAIVKIFNL